MQAHDCNVPTVDAQRAANAKLFTSLEKTAGATYQFRLESGLNKQKLSAYAISSCNTPTIFDHPTHPFQAFAVGDGSKG
jgi:hypothetical protein